MHLHRRRDAATVTEHGRVAIHRPRTDPRELHPVLDAGIDILDHISDLLDRAESRINGRSPEGKLGGNHGPDSVPRASSIRPRTRGEYGLTPPAPTDTRPLQH